MEITHSSVITYLFSAYHEETNKRRMQIYYDAIKDLPPEILFRTVQKLVYSQKFMPSIAEIVEATRSLMVTAGVVQGTKSWDEAWAEINKAMLRVGYMGKPEFSTPEIAAAVNAYGWMNLVMLESKDYNTASAQCRRYYEDACKRSADERVNTAVLNGNGLRVESIGQPNKKALESKRQGLTSIAATLSEGRMAL